MVRILADFGTVRIQRIAKVRVCERFLVPNFILRSCIFDQLGVLFLSGRSGRFATTTSNHRPHLSCTSQRTTASLSELRFGQWAALSVLAGPAFRSAKRFGPFAASATSWCLRHTRSPAHPAIKPGKHIAVSRTTRAPTFYLTKLTSATRVAYG
ncbi:hypothetical protein CPB85DRAFT_159459 [Mucidula mucida]|nr:hypothetical protein CPB85DRAFT_159459 [Mucidula mucida]